MRRSLDLARRPASPASSASARRVLASALWLAAFATGVSDVACNKRGEDPIHAVRDEAPDAGPPRAEGPFVVAGAPGTCVILEDHTARCVGAAPIGPGAAELIRKLGPVAQIALGDAHACALDLAGKVMCWGSNVRGQIGDGDPAYHDRPRSPSGLRDVVELSLAGDASCARLRDGTVRCWGNNVGGHLGCAEPTCPTPHAIAGVEGAAQIALADDHACARLADGRVMCWGANASGQLGLGKTSHDERPTIVEGLIAEQLALGAEFSCARTADARVLCWGSNDQRQLGVEPRRLLHSASPLVVDGARGAIELESSGSSWHVCARIADGRVRCWGDNEHDELGNGGDDESDTPHDVVDGYGRALGSVAQIAVGALHACARTTEGKLLCWGDDTFGELGRGPSKAVRFVKVPMPVLWW